MSIYFIIGVLTFLTFLFAASFKICWGVYMKSICRINSNSRTAILTFDDGPHPINTPEILDLLKMKGIKATFFVIGKNVQMYPNIIKRISDEGHNIGIHSYYHNPSFTIMRKKSLFKDICKCKKLLEELTQKPIVLFRPPYGVTNPNIGRVIRSMNLKSIGWSIRSFDTIFSNEDIIVNKIIRKLSPGAIILLHDRLDNSLSILTKLLQKIEERRYKIDSL